MMMMAAVRAVTAASLQPTKNAETSFKTHYFGSESTESTDSEVDNPQSTAACKRKQQRLKIAAIVYSSSSSRSR